MESMVSTFSGPWAMIGDFNSIKNAGEKSGGKPTIESSVNNIRTFITNTAAIDLGFKGPPFTWTNKREDLANIRERLDQCMCNQEWQLLFPKAGVAHLCATNSDHSPILLDINFENEKIARPFRFEAMWTKDETSREVVDKAWQLQVEGSQGFKLARKQTNTKNELKKWNKEHFGNVRERIKVLEKKIEEVQGAEPTKENLELEVALSLELDDWLVKESLKWQQKSREIWLKEGDRNSRFFLLTTLVRRRRNFISDIKQEDSSWISGREAIQEYFKANFQSLYQSSRPQIPESLLEKKLRRRYLGLNHLNLLDQTAFQLSSISTIGKLLGIKLRW
ncbi:uncharacterized protein LOC142632996 [Castanea sativa]|uniref:uncharacterized protein LOC142632996 n=1 Tax=Castanea sativa TaxID=21020 RepID=UPI003F651F59